MRRFGSGEIVNDTGCQQAGPKQCDLDGLGGGAAEAEPTVSIGTSESPAQSDPWLPPPRVAAAQIGELVALGAETITSPRSGQRRLHVRASG